MVAKSIRILVVDDEYAIREACARILERDGYQVAIASNGLDGLELFHEQAFDLALVDIKMPVLDGMKLMEILHKDNPELNLDGHDRPRDEKNRDRSHGRRRSRYFLSKPFNPQRSSAGPWPRSPGALPDQIDPEEVP